jgi:hypothetical protein
MKPIAPLELSSGRKRRRVVAGEFMVTPVKPLELAVDGRWEVLRPGRSRLAPDHPVVRKRPEWFRPADPRDVVTARHHVALLRCTRQALERESSRRRVQTGTAGSSAPRRRSPYAIPARQPPAGG